MKKVKLILLHILEDCSDIQNFIAGMNETDFMNNNMVKKAVCMSLINIGELVKSLPMDFCEKYSELPWRKIAGMRDITAHKYKQLDMIAVWRVAKERIPELLKFINTYLENEI
jgi:uncharacterized protein with HEPN domain